MRRRSFAILHTTGLTDVGKSCVYREELWELYTFGYQLRHVFTVSRKFIALFSHKEIQKTASWLYGKSARGVLVLKAPLSPGQIYRIASLRPLDFLLHSLIYSFAVSFTRSLGVFRLSSSLSTF